MVDSSEFKSAEAAEQALSKIEDRCQLLAQEVHQLYRNYLTALARAIRTCVRPQFLRNVSANPHHFALSRVRKSGPPVLR